MLKIKDNVEEIKEEVSSRRLILDYLLENNIFAEDFADDLGITEKELGLILKGEKEIDKELAEKISKETGLSTVMLLGLQLCYDVHFKKLQKGGNE